MTTACLRRSQIGRQVDRGLTGHVAPEVREPPGDGDPEAGGGRLELRLEPGEHAFELQTGIAQVSRARRDAKRRRDNGVVQRWHEYLDIVVPDHPNAVEKVLLRREHSRGRSLRRRREPVHELVDSRCGQAPGSNSSEQMPSRQRHSYEAGDNMTSPRMTRSRLATTCLYVYGGATCSLTVYSEPL